MRMSFGAYQLPWLRLQARRKCQPLRRQTSCFVPWLSRSRGQERSASGGLRPSYIAGSGVRGFWPQGVPFARSSSACPFHLMHSYWWTKLVAR